MRPLIIYNGPLFDGKNVYEDGAVYVENGKIVEAGDEEEVFKKIPRRMDMDFYDARGRVIFPGITNLHNHFYTVLSHGLMPGRKLLDLKTNLESFWWKFDASLTPEIVQISALVSLLESIRHGVTTIFDHHSSPSSISNILEVIASVVKRSGIDAVLCYEISDRHGREKFYEALDENLNFIEKYKYDKQIKGMLGLHANFTLSDESLYEISENVSGVEAGIHIHCGEDKIDMDYCTERGYKGPVHRLSRFGLVSSRSILAHGLFLSQEDYGILKSSGATVVCNAESNMRNGYGVFDLERFEEAKFGLGTDGMTSNMFLTLRSAYLSQRQMGKPSSVVSSELFNSLFGTNSEVATKVFGRKVGVIEKGASADIVIFDYVPLVEFNLETLFSHVAFGMCDTPAVVVFKNGKMIFEKGTFFTLDEELILEESKKLSKILWENFYNL